MFDRMIFIMGVNPGQQKQQQQENNQDRETRQESDPGWLIACVAGSRRLQDERLYVCHYSRMRGGGGLALRRDP